MKAIKVLSMVMSLALMTMFGASGCWAQDKAKDAKAASAAKAEKGKIVQKVLFENDKVRVTETTYQPGDVSPSIARPFRVSRSLTGGTLERTWADGKKETIEWKPGEVRASGPDTQAFQNKNVGKKPFVFYTVNIKEAKK
jgi:hypothetical protein